MGTTFRTIENEHVTSGTSLEVIIAAMFLLVINHSLTVTVYIFD